jgi:glycosyltransferase involved in cell wall biosynthesis
MVVGVPSIAVDCESGPRVILAERQSKTSFTNESEQGVEQVISTELTQDQLPGGLLIPNDTASMSDAIRLFMADSQTRERTGRQGIDVAEGFGWQELVDRYEAVLNKVVGNLN